MGGLLIFSIMANQFAVFHAMKGKGAGDALGRHIDREIAPENADPELRHLNRYMVHEKEGKISVLSQAEFDTHRRQGQIKNMLTSVNERIAEGYTHSRTIRSNAVRYVNLMLSGSPERMAELMQQGKLSDWMQANYRYVSKEFGSANIVRFAMHCDEKTPHIHATVVPLTADGRLSARDYLFGHRSKLRGFQDRYAKAMQPFGLERGLENKKVHHQTTQQYYRGQMHATQLSLPEIAAKERRSLLGLGKTQQYYEIDKASLDGFVLAQKGQLERAQKEAQTGRQQIGSAAQVVEQWRTYAEQLADLVDGRDQILRDVAEGKITPEQLKESLEKADREMQQGKQKGNRDQGFEL